MGDGKPDGLRRRILAAPYGHPQVKKPKIMLRSVREGEAVRERHREPVEDHDLGAITTVAPIVVEKPDNIIDLQPVPHSSLFLTGLAAAGVGFLYEMITELEDTIDDL